ncbi:major facilitator superfamily domain-containing protein, partial [Vararia minispora EC-137]
VIPAAPSDGGMRAWLTIFGAWLVQFCTYGTVASFGVYQDFYTREFLVNSTASDISWIGSLQLALQYLPGFFVGRGFDSGYFHHMSILGSGLYTFSIFMLSLVNRGQYYQVFLAQGIGMGLGQGLTFLPSLAIISHHFRRRRALATGIAVTGASAGGVIFPIMLNRLFHSSVGFADGVRASAGLVGGLLLAANILMRTTVSRKHAVRFELHEIRSILSDWVFMWALAGAFAVSLGLFFPYFYFQLWSIEHGIDAQLAFYTLAIINAGTIAGRLLPTFLADHIGVFNMIIPAVFLSAVFVFATFGATTATSIIIVSLLYGFTSGAYVSLIPPMLSQITPNLTELGTRMGFAFSVVGLAMLSGAPILGALLGRMFAWWRPTVFSGV